MSDKVVAFKPAMPGEQVEAFEPTTGEQPTSRDGSTSAPGAQTLIRATPYQWIDPEKITPRDWLYGRIYIRKFVTATVAPGATGKDVAADRRSSLDDIRQGALGDHPSQAIKGLVDKSRRPV